MITGYDYKKINNEKILILYLNYDIEFGIDFKTNHKNSSMKDEIKKFIKKRKIKINGEKIFLSFGGLILAVLLLVESPTNMNEFELTYVSDHIVPNEIVEVLKPEIKNDIIINNDIKEEIKENIEVEKNNNDEIIDFNEEIENIKDSSSNVDDNKDVNIDYENSIDEDNKDIDNVIKDDIQVDKTEQLVTIYRSNGSVINLSLDDYLIGVVGAEMPASFNIEALKAQAIVARTYALKKIEKNEKLTDTVSTQSYKDVNQLKEYWGNSFDNYYKKIKDAVLSTKDLVIYYDEELIDAVYHSTSNGKTEDSLYVWGNSIPYLKSVDSSWDKEATSYLRETSKDFNNIIDLLDVNLESDISFEILSRDESGRVLEIKVGDKVYDGVEFRNLLGLRSADFDLELNSNSINIITRGYGHGVGMSQYGANGMAKNGYNYEQILKHYYTGVRIDRFNKNIY